MAWISEAEAAAILEVSQPRMNQMRNGYKNTKGGKVYFIAPKVPPDKWRHTTQIEYDKDYIESIKKPAN